MSLKQTYGWRNSPDLDYMTRQERLAFTNLVKAEAIGFYRIGHCEKCSADVPKSKRFCSAACAGVETDGEQEDIDGVVD